MKINWFILTLVVIILGKVGSHLHKDFKEKAINEKILQERQDRKSVNKLGN